MLAGNAMGRARSCTHKGMWLSRYELRQLAHDLRTDESSSSDYHDLHDFAFR